MAAWFIMLIFLGQKRQLEIKIGSRGLHVATTAKENENSENWTGCIPFIN